MRSFLSGRYTAAHVPQVRKAGVADSVRVAGVACGPGRGGDCPRPELYRSLGGVDVVTDAAGKAVVLLSGGLDSATVLAEAAAAGRECHTLAVDYGQRHRAELEAARRLSGSLGAVSHRVVRVDLRAIGGSALTDDIDVPEAEAEGIPVTYVPARNTLMLSLALGHAEVIGAYDLFVGVNAVDYSGYPDCRPQFITAFEALCQVATRAGAEGARFRVHAPLISLSKADIIRRGTALGVDYSLTVSCYQADDTGRACGRCDSCRLRRAGFDAAGLNDPTRYASRR